VKDLLAARELGFDGNQDSLIVPADGEPADPFCGSGLVESSRYVDFFVLGSVVGAGITEVVETTIPPFSGVLVPPGGIVLPAI
jgi:hypothetical protein